MKKLMQLEIEKYKLKKQLFGIVLTILGIMIFLSISFMDNHMNSIQQLDTSENIRWMINLLNTGAFLVYSSTLISKIIISEYLKGTIFVLFSYPINKKKLLLSKVVLIVLFTVSAIILGDIICTLYVNFLNQKIQVITSPIPWNTDLFLLFIFGMLLGGILSIVPFIVGMLNKSTSIPIVTAVILVVIMQSFIDRDPEVYQAVLTLIGSTSIVLLLAGYTLSHKIQEW